jgi:predicted ribosomally synthesized peptide with SipW-like signal peptide
VIGRKRKWLLTLVVVGLTGSIAGFGTYSAFSSTTSNTGNQFAAGTVSIGDNDAGSAMYTVTNQKPNVNTVKCIQVTYSGSLDADVKLYTTTTTIPAAATNLLLTIEKGTSTGSTGFPDCGTFTAQGGPIYSGSLRDFQQTKNSYANGVSAYPGAATKWVTSDALVYRFTVSANDSAGGVDSGLHQFTWEAQNQ